MYLLKLSTHAGVAVVCVPDTIASARHVRDYAFALLVDKEEKDMDGRYLTQGKSPEDLEFFDAETGGIVAYFAD
ncbi:MAG: hypothetical protein ABIH21_03475 [Patescibacteria group bacterium]